MRRTGTTIAALLITAVSVLAAPDRPAQDQQPPVFRAGTETVAIYATVLDRYGGTIRGLTADDFEVYEDGRRRPITIFEAGLQPISAVVMVDTSASMTFSLQLATTAAEQFVIRLLPGDRAGVGSFSNRVDLSRGFTGDRDALLQSLRELQIGNPTRLWDAIETTLQALEPLGGRRVLVLMTDGMDTASDLAAASVLARAGISEVMVYVVQFRSNRQANLAEFPLSPSAAEIFGGDGRRELRSSRRQLTRLARQSGGGYFLLGPNDDVNATFSALLRELHYQYVIGFTPAHADDGVHTLEVGVRDPELIVRARRTYAAARPADDVP